MFTVSKTTPKQFKLIKINGTIVPVMMEGFYLRQRYNKVELFISSVKEDQISFLVQNPDYYDERNTRTEEADVLSLDEEVICEIEVDVEFNFDVEKLNVQPTLENGFLIYDIDLAIEKWLNKMASYLKKKEDEIHQERQKQSLRRMFHKQVEFLRESEKASLKRLTNKKLTEEHNTKKEATVKRYQKKFKRLQEEFLDKTEFAFMAEEIRQFNY